VEAVKGARIMDQLVDAADAFATPDARVGHEHAVSALEAMEALIRQAQGGGGVCGGCGGDPTFQPMRAGDSGRGGGQSGADLGGNAGGDQQGAGSSGNAGGRQQGGGTGGGGGGGRAEQGRGNRGGRGGGGDRPGRRGRDGRTGRGTSAGRTGESGGRGARDNPARFEEDGYEKAEHDQTADELGLDRGRKEHADRVRRRIRPEQIERRMRRRRLDDARPLRLPPPRAPRSARGAGAPRGPRPYGSSAPRLTLSPSEREREIATFDEFLGKLATDERRAVQEYFRLILDVKK
jgi:hypothetical protein